MRLLLLALSASLLAGCPPVRADDDDSSACATELVACATYNGTPAAGAVTVRSGPSDPGPLASPLDASGCATFALDAGTWEWSAEHATDTCVSVFTTVELTECDATHVTVELIEWCFDG
jgi:hypothetical protein